MKALTGSGKVSLTLLATLLGGVAELLVKGVIHIGEYGCHAMRLLSNCWCTLLWCRYTGEPGWRHSKWWVRRVSTPLQEIRLLHRGARHLEVGGEECSGRDHGTIFKKEAPVT
jgi:hypothetical protein